MSGEAFRPEQSATVQIDVEDTTKRVEMPLQPGSQSVRIVSSASTTVYIEFGGASVDASLTSSMPVRPGITEVLDLPPEFDGYIAAISDGHTGLIFFTPGVGV